MLKIIFAEAIKSDQRKKLFPFPTEQKNIKAKINRYERELRKEYEAHKYIDDSSGTRREAAYRRTAAWCGYDLGNPFILVLSC